MYHSDKLRASTGLLEHRTLASKNQTTPLPPYEMVATCHRMQVYIDVEFSPAGASLILNVERCLLTVEPHVYTEASCCNSVNLREEILTAGRTVVVVTLVWDAMLCALMH